jgi:hypothetical protein
VAGDSAAHGGGGGGGGGGNEAAAGCLPSQLIAAVAEMLLRLFVRALNHTRTRLRLACILLHITAAEAVQVQLHVSNMVLTTSYHVFDWNMFAVVKLNKARVRTCLWRRGCGRARRR